MIDLVVVSISVGGRWWSKLVDWVGADGGMDGRRVGVNEGMVAWE